MRKEEFIAAPWRQPDNDAVAPQPPSDRRSIAEIHTELKARLAKLKSGEDIGMSFEDVFGEPLNSP